MITATMEQMKNLDDFVEPRGLRNASRILNSHITWYLPLPELIKLANYLSAKSQDTFTRGMANTMPGFQIERSFLESWSSAYLVMMPARPSQIPESLPRLKDVQRNLEAGLERESRQKEIQHVIKQAIRRELDPGTNSPERELMRAAYFSIGRLMENLMNEHLKAKLQRFERLINVDMDAAINYLQFVPNFITFTILKGEDAEKTGEILHEAVKAIDPKTITDYVQQDVNLYSKLISRFEVIRPCAVILPKKQYAIEGNESSNGNGSNGGGLYHAALVAVSPVKRLFQNSDDLALKLAEKMSGLLTEPEMNVLRRSIRRIKPAGKTTRHQAETFYSIMERKILETRSAPTPEDASWMYSTAMQRR